MLCTRHTLLALLVGLASAAPANKPSFTKECTDIRLKDSWLVASCKVSPGNSDEVAHSSVYLPNKITNKESVLNWLDNGAYANSCKDCTVINGGGTLKCTCRSTWNGWQDSSLDLEEHITNLKGVLKSDIRGPPSPPSSISPTPVPTDFSYALKQGNYSCFGKDCDTTLTPGTSPACDGSFSLTGGAPQDCFAFHWPVAGDRWSGFQSASLEAPSGAWEAEVYDDLECRGKAVAKIGPEDGRKCFQFEKVVVGVKMRPLWNAD